MITSSKNEIVKHYQKLMSSKKERDKYQQFIVEGEHLVSEAIKENLVEEILIAGDKYDYFKKYPHQEVTDEIINKICETKTPQGVIAKCRQLSKKITKFNRLLLLDNIQDPGNIGTIIRTSDAFNFDGIIINTQTVDIYNPKVIRSTQGAIFRIPILRKELKTYIPELIKHNVVVYGTSLNGEPLSEIKSCQNMAFILGNEGNGVNPDILTMTEKNIYIEMNGHSESLNVAIAGAIIMYNFRK